MMILEWFRVRMVGFCMQCGDYMSLGPFAPSSPDHALDCTQVIVCCSWLAAGLRDRFGRVRQKGDFLMADFIAFHITIDWTRTLFSMLLLHALRRTSEDGHGWSIIPAS